MKHLIKVAFACAAVLLLSACGAQVTQTALANESLLVGIVDEVGDGSLTLTNLYNSEKTTVVTTDATEVRSQVSQGAMGGGTPGEGGVPGGGSPSGEGMPSAPGGEAAEKSTPDAGTPPEMPSDSAQNSQQEADAKPPALPADEQQEQGSSSDKTEAVTVSTGDKVCVLLGGQNVAMRITIMSNEASTQTYSAQNTVTDSKTYSDTTLSADGTDENVILVKEDGDVQVQNATIERTSSSSSGGDTASFYGVGAAILAEQGRARIENSTISTDAKGGAGVFAYGPGVAIVKNTSITTRQNQSGGIHVAGGGTLYAEDVTAETYGENSAAIRSDRGSGSMLVKRGSYVSHGLGSPALYSTADIYAADATLEATGAEALCIEGLNSAYLKNVELTGNMPGDENDDFQWNVILYQSMSGDAADGESQFTMDGGSLTAHTGGMFYTTNTDSEFVLKNVSLTPSSENPFLLRCTGNSNKRGWGSAGKNGATCTFTGIDQELTGDVQWDSISNLSMYLRGSSKLTGAFVQDESDAGNGGDGKAELTIESGATWVVTGDSRLSSLNNAGRVVDEDGKTVRIVDSSGAVLVAGESSVTITVDAYSCEVDFSGAGHVD